MKDPNRKHEVLGGVAGSGKSTIIPYIISEYGGGYSVRVCAPTGKAALVLKRKGIVDACTLHSFLYEYRIRKNEAGVEEFVHYEKPMMAFAGVSLVIVDEASMVNREMFEYMDRLPFKTLYIGDHFQLPPVKDDFNIMLDPGYRMDTVLRQNADNPIVMMADMARHGKTIPLGDYGDSRKTRSFNEADLLEYDEILVWTNEMRRNVNDMIRSRLGYERGIPHCEDKVICRMNNMAKNVYNGQIFHLMSTPARVSEHGWDVSMMDDVVYNDPYLMASNDGNVKGIGAFNIDKMKFRGEGMKANLMEKRIGLRSKVKMEILLDWGYAITVHSAQGSSWPRVAVIEEPRMKHVMDTETYHRWIYTACTRAEDSVTIYSLS